MVIKAKIDSPANNGQLVLLGVNTNVADQIVGDLELEGMIKLINSTINKTIII